LWGGELTWLRRGRSSRAALLNLPVVVDDDLVIVTLQALRDQLVLKPPHGLRRMVIVGQPEIGQHLDGPMTVSPLPYVAGQPKRAEIRGRGLLGSLLGVEDCRLSLEPGAGLEPATC
jgi:hypothetical protein